MQYPISIGIDIGGSHITCAAIKIQEGILLEETLARAAYSHEAPAVEIFQHWANAINTTLAHLDESHLAGIGFAIPGPFDYRNGISRMEHKFKSLFGLHIPNALNPLLHTEKELPMRFLNDATSFAVGEAWLGEGKGFEKVVVVTLGTGFGSAFIDEGVPVVTGDTVPREGCLWHLPFKEGIADDYFSTRWFTGEYEKLSGLKIEGVRELIERVDTDAIARNLFLQLGQNLAECLWQPLQKFGAEVLILGGNIAHALPLFEAEFQAGLQKNGVRIKTIQSKHMEHAALIGSARLLDDAFWAKVSERLPNL